METKAITPSFTERGTIVCPAATVNSKLRAIENLFESCDNKLAGAEMSGCGYTSQSGEIDSMTENMRNLSLYAVTAHERVSDHLDRPLYEHFKKNATETITAINLSEITTENTFGLAEYVEIKRQGQYFVNKSVKNNLTMKDFLGLQEITAEDGTPILENAETMWEFASLFRLEYDTMTEKAVDLDSYLNWYLDTGDAEHKGYHPAADMISGILDITIVKPVLECILGKDLITGEYLTEYDIRWKQAGIIIDFVTLGGGSKLIKGGMSLKEFLKASGKTLTVDALTATATYGTAYIGEEIGLSEEAILVLSTLAGIGTSYTAGKAIIKDAKVVVEGGVDASFTWKLRGEDVILNDVKVQEISYVKRNSIELKTLRDEFNTTTRKAFLEDLGNNAEYLRKAGFSETDILKIQNGRVPDGWQVHHKLPLDDSGTNSFDNLVLIQNEPYHKVITNYQNSIARQMEIGEVQAVQWPMPNGNIYPAQH